MKNSQLFIVVILSTIAYETYGTYCTSDPCQNGGTCYSGTSSYLCICPGKFSGQNCEIYQDDSDYSATTCSPNTCFNGGTCYTGLRGSFYCLCASAYRGAQCEMSTDSDAVTTAVPGITTCTPSTCQNGGTCYTSSTSGNFLCSCPSGYGGIHCESVATMVQPYAVIYCASNPCNNGGTCYTGRSEYICMCPTDFTGYRCQSRVLCGSDPCLNNGTCYTGLDSYTCICDRGYNGANCETSVLCGSSPCQNNGTCFTGESSYQCICSDGFTGEYCETLASCMDVPCNNGGTCIPIGDNTADTMCACPENFSGVRCQYQVDICSSSQPCNNGGTCFTSSEDRATFVCSCQHGFEGQLCERSNPCADNPCQNGGICSHPLDPENDMVMCQCTNGYVGLRCEIRDTGVGACVIGICMNGGTCVPSPFATGGLTCTCPASNTGSRCEQQIPLACESNPCLNGAVCDDTGDGNYRCTCLEGYAGRMCEVVGPCVSSPCMNEGICVEDVYNPGSFSCHCLNQYTGATCTIPPQEDPCNSNPCQNDGVCVPTSIGTSYLCECSVDFVGSNCDIPDPCSPSPCQNSGVCNAIPVVGGWSFFCVCTGQFLGLTCSVQRACVSNPCQHGGQCMDVPGSASQPIYGTELTSEMLNYNCHCLEGWTGQNCETLLIDPCQSNPCQNNGTCFRSHSANQFFCSCPVGFYRPFCVSDPCAASPCKNNGTCQSTGNQYTCTCRTGYAGVNCTVEDLCHTEPCKNGGSCSLTATSFECSCAEGYVGDDCSQPDPCLLEPCLNGGNCIGVKRGAANTIEYQCLCPLGYGGLTCGVYFGDPIGATRSPVRPCDPNPCENGGSCFQSDEGDFVCYCPTSFTGNLCQTAVSTAPDTTPMTPEPTTTAEPSGCLDGTQTYMDGDTWKNGCRDCNCTGTLRSCSLERCKCTLGSRIFNSGESWTVGCQLCSCLSGMPSCSDMGCKDRCLHESTVYEPGSTRTDNCNTCECQAGGWECTNNDCGQTCTYMSIVYLSNEERKDDCNSCYCLEGQWSCTTKACDADPIIIKVEFDFSNDFTNVAGKEDRFTEALVQNLNLLLGLKNNHIQDMAISAGSIKVKFNLVENKTDNINIETVAIVLEMAITKNSYNFLFEQQQFQSVPDSFKMEQQNTLSPAASTNTLTIIIVVVGCGVLGLLIVIASVCLLVRKHSTGRQLRVYGPDKLGRRSDKMSANGFSNEDL